MAISTIGNVTYINQNMQATSMQHANATQRGDFIPQEFEDKLKEIEEVRPTEENEPVNKDSHNSQDSSEQEEQNPQNQESKDSADSIDSQILQDGHLDIKV